MGRGGQARCGLRASWSGAVGAGPGFAWHRGPRGGPGARAQIERMAPPSTGIIAPVVKDAAGESRNAAARPNSTGSPYLRSGMCSDWRARSSSGSPLRASNSRTLSVAILTGSIPFTRIPAGPSSSASIFTTPARAGNNPLEMASSASGTRTEEASTKTMEPSVPVREPAGPPSLLPLRSAARTRASRTAPRKTLSNADRQASSVVVATVPAGDPPTLISAPSRRPKRFRAAAISRPRVNAGDLRSAGGCQALLSVCRCRRVVMADRGCDLDDPQVGAGLAGRVLVPAAERGFDPAGADAWPAGRVQAGQDGPADVPGQVARAVQDVAGAGDQGLGCFDGDLVAGPVGVGARDGGHGVGDRDPQRLVEGQQRPHLLLQ